MNTTDSIKNLSSWEFLAILDSIDDAVFIDDSDGIAIWCNEACQELYKVTPKDVVGLHVLELEKRGIFSPSVANRVLQEKREVTIIHENKEGKKLLSTGTPLIDENGDIIRVITTSRDITELTNMQNQLQAVQGTLEGIKSLEKGANQEIIVASHAMFNVMQLAKRLATVDSTVLITGESGVGKGLIAQLLHQNGSRKSSPLVTVNCGAIPENLIESELFGYERGAFTGSRAEGKKGLFEVAQGGTIFLDEISELPLNLQVKLLQVIQDREIIRVGAIKKIPIDVRIISATNQDLHKLVEEGQFREDLYYRLNVVPIHVPPLRERPEDIIPLVRKYLSQFNKRLNDHKQLDTDAMAVLLKYEWPGNIRELQNIVERLILTTKEKVISVENLPGFMAHMKSKSVTPKIPDAGMTLSDILDQAEKETLIYVMEKHKSTRTMAKALGISQPSVVRKLHKHGLSNVELK